MNAPSVIKDTLFSLRRAPEISQSDGETARLTAMAKPIDQFKTWLLERRDFLFSRTARDPKEIKEPEESLKELPSSLREKLIAATDNLVSNPADVEAIKSAINKAFDRWRDRPQNADNSIVVVSSPVNSVSRIIAEILEEWAKEKQISVNLLSWKTRPTDTKDIASKLQQELKLGITKANPESLEVVVIPNFSWCFLRSLEGLDGIDYLQSLLLQDRYRFWIIGAALVGWDYLNSVTNFGAYCGEVFSLPSLEGESLKKWLTPIFSEFDLSFAKPHLDPQLLDKDKSLEDIYFDKLASVSYGVSVVAVQVFLHSIGYKSSKEKSEDKNKNGNNSTQILIKQQLEKMIPDQLEKEAHNLKEKAKAAVTNEQQSPSPENKNQAAITNEEQYPSSKNDSNEANKILQVESPKLPDLPTLNAEDHYLLYSLLLHGDISLSALAESLGDEESKVQAQVQMLRRAGVVEEKNQILKVNPIHYPKLKRELANNNFVINKID